MRLNRGGYADMKVGLGACEDFVVTGACIGCNQLF